MANVAQIGAIPMSGCEDGFHNCGAFMQYGGGYYPLGPGEDPYIRGPISSAGGTVPVTAVTALTPPVKVASRPSVQNETGESGETSSFGFGILVASAALIGIGMLMSGKEKAWE